MGLRDGSNSEITSLVISSAAVPPGAARNLALAFRRRWPLRGEKSLIELIKNISFIPKAASGTIGLDQRHQG
jgi:hypothetical protein